MFVVDTNILVYAADRDAPAHLKSRGLVEKWRRQLTPWYVTWGIIYEFLRVSTHRNVFRKPLSVAQSWDFIGAILAAPSARLLVETDRHAQVAAEVLADMPDISGNFVFDTHTAILMREHGVKTIFTCDTDFNRFPFLDVVDPIHEHRGPRR